MRALAEFIMRGRLQAALVAFFGSLLPLLSPAAISLVTLNKGLSEGGLVMLWALLPLLMAFYVSELSPMITLASIAGLIVVVAASELLRSSTSWSRTLVFIVVISGLAAIALDVLFTEQADALELMIVNLFSQVQQQLETAFIPGRTFLLGVIGYVIALTSIVCLVLGRWWQATLYNQGGFRLEFHQLRFSLVSAVTLLVGVVVCYFAPQEYSSWAGLLGLPLLLGGIALVHYSVAFYQLGAHWLAIFYVGLFMIGPLSLILVGLGFIDSIMNIRSRLARRPKGL
tara:strand:+ start:2657 stop:3511 length:855 start_codon:yes stop_codon:yes gene_type:complete